VRRIDRALLTWTTLATWVIIGAALFTAFASLVTGWSAPPLNSADEAAHLDYAVDVWHGHLPVFEDGLTIQPPFGKIPPVQWVAQHPPLYYAVLAPFVGPLWDAHHPYVSVLAGRSVNAIWTTVTVLAVGWAVRRVLPRRPELAAVAAVVMALTPMFLLLGGQIYNDLPNMLFAALAIGIGATALRSGLSTRLVVGGAVVAALGILTRLSFAVFLVGILVAFLLARWRRGGFWTDWRGHLVAVASVLVVPGLASGWFYLRNRALTGSFVGNHPEWGEEHLRRHTYEFDQVIVSPGWWKSLFALFRGHLEGSTDWTYLLLIGPLVLGLVVAVVGAVVALVRRVGRSRRTADVAERRDTDVLPRTRQEIVADLLVTAMLVALALGVLYLQVRFSMTGGAPNVRYSLALMPILVVPMALGLAGLGRYVGPVLTVLWMEVTGYIWFQIQNVSTPAFTSVHALTVSRTTFIIALVFFSATVVGVCALLLRRRRAFAAATPASAVSPPATPAASVPTAATPAASSAAAASSADEPRHEELGHDESRHHELGRDDHRGAEPQHAAAPAGAPQHAAAPADGSADAETSGGAPQHTAALPVDDPRPATTPVWQPPTRGFVDDAPRSADDDGPDAPGAGPAASGATDGRPGPDDDRDRGPEAGPRRSDW